MHRSVGVRGVKGKRAKGQKGKIEMHKRRDLGEGAKWVMGNLDKVEIGNTGRPGPNAYLFATTAKPLDHRSS